jgi:hypothetical protein
MVTKCDKATTGVPTLGTYHKKILLKKKIKIESLCKENVNLSACLTVGQSKYSNSEHVN